jgi:Ca2+-binding RTX toxin-like protein
VFRCLCSFLVVLSIMSKATSLWLSIRSLFQRSKRRAKGLAPRLSLESLEDRRLLSVSPNQIRLSNANLQITGGSEADSVTVSEPTAGTINVEFVSGGETLSVNFDKSQVQTIYFYGNEGNDTFRNTTDLVARASGHGGNDTLVGGSAADVLDGGEGDDNLDGGDGADKLYGGTGADNVNGGTGDDSLWGGAGDDTLSGGDGVDRILGEEGNDTISGNKGDDTLSGGEGNDNLSGDEGNDLVTGGLGDDTLWGRTGNDRLFGEAGVDTLMGDDGLDELSGGDESDLLYGGNDNDKIDGDSGDDWIYGGAGDDSLSGEDGDDTIFGEAGNDSLSGGLGNDSIMGGLGNDKLLGDAGHDTLHGDEGVDELRGGDDDDALYGGTDNDVIYGDAGNDLLIGGTGDDSLLGKEGDDTMYGEAGNDVLTGGDGFDVMFGQEGNDRLFGEAGQDALYGDAGIDELRGGEDGDILIGGADNDALYGEGGQDLLIGGAGDDSLSGGDANDTLQGNIGNDALSGGEGFDVLYGHEGNDRLFGDAGQDTLYGGDGLDELRGGEDGDTLYGDAGNDVLYGEGGMDRLYGGDGDDSLSGGDGNDSLNGQAGNDVISGGLGDDVLSGKEGDDRLWGDAGSDTLFGDAGNDELRGEDDGDTLRGGDGNDILYGGGGKDRLIGGAGDDSLSGGDGNDALGGDEGNDSLTGGAGSDLIMGDSGDDYILGDAGADSLYGGDGIDEIRGGDDDDLLYGGSGNDSLYGDNHNDRIFGEAGLDNVSGGEGNDILSGGDDADVLRGGNGHDALLGDAGSDSLEGQDGNDILIGGTDVDTLYGANGDDLLIGASVTHSPQLLDQLLAKWSSSDNYEARVAAIEDHHYAAYLKSEETILDDYVADIVYGGADKDWFFVPGALSFYNPLSHEDHEHEHMVATDEPQAHTGGGGHHNVHVVDHIPVVEGFDLIDSLDKLQDNVSGEAVHTIVPHADSASKRQEHIAMYELVRYDQITHYAIQSGNWSDPATWHDGIVPTANARVLIPMDVLVTVDRVLLPEIATIRVDGTLAFATQANTALRVDTIIVSDVGAFVMGTEEEPIAANVQAKLTFTDNGAINRTWDPFGMSRGLITHGAVRIHGAEVTSSVTLAVPALAGTTVLQLAGATTGWKVGDKLVIAGTQGTSQSEERVIRGILGNTIFVDPLQYNHSGLSAAQSVHVANVTRNVVIDSEGNAQSRRGHVMFMHNRDVDVYYASFMKLGRSDKTQVVNDSVVDANWNLVAGTGTNPRARYAVHFHRNGMILDGNPSIVHGSVVEDNGGWGFVNHSSYVDFTNNVAYNVTGAGFVTEVGDEIGSFRNNIAINMKASGDHIESRLFEQDHGHTGDGFWFQGSGITVVNNVAADAEGHAFVFYSRGLEFGGKPTFATSNLADPSIANGASSIFTEHVPVQEFSNNIGYSSGVGLSVWYNLREATHDAQSIFEDSVFWNNSTGAEIMYSESIVLRDIAFLHDFAATMPDRGVKTNGVTKDVTYDNLTVSGYYTGAEAAFRGYTIVNGGTYATKVGISVRTGPDVNRTVTIQGGFTMLPLPAIVPKNTLQTDVLIRFTVSAFEGSVDHLFYDTKVYLNYGPYINRRLYATVQAPDAIPFPEASAGLPGYLVGLTTFQIWQQHGLKVLGEIAPADAISLPNFGGLLK